VLVSFVILTYRRGESVHTLLSQLTQLKDDQLEIIVVDNGSGPETAEAIRRKFPQVKLVVLEENAGVGSRNRGLEIARGEIVITLDDDMVDFSEGALAHLRMRFKADQKLAAINFKVVWPGTDKIRDWVHRRPPDHCDTSFPTYEITEGAVAWRLSALRQVGFYREDFFISHEGLELALRLLDKNWVIEYDGKVKIGHAHAAAARASWRRYYYDTRNLFAIAVLHMPVWHGFRYLLVGTAAMLVYSLRDRQLAAWGRGFAHGVGKVSYFRKERKVWQPQTAKAVSEADSWRPGFWKMVLRRLSQKDFSME